jgi:hypothetical protein
MSDRGVFVVAFTTVVLMGGGAFAIPQFFPFELLKSLIYVAIAILVFFGENQYSYMLGIVSPVVGWISTILAGGFLHDFKVLFASIAMKPISGLDTPLHALALISQALLAVLSWRAWNKEVPHPFVGKALWTCLAIAVGHATVVFLYFVKLVSCGWPGGPPRRGARLRRGFRSDFPRGRPQTICYDGRPGEFVP